MIANRPVSYPLPEKLSIHQAQKLVALTGGKLYGEYTTERGYQTTLEIGQQWLQIVHIAVLDMLEGEWRE